MQRWRFVDSYILFLNGLKRHPEGEFQSVQEAVQHDASNAEQFYKAGWEDNQSMNQ